MHEVETVEFLHYERDRMAIFLAKRLDDGWRVLSMMQDHHSSIILITLTRKSFFRR